MLTTTVNFNRALELDPEYTSALFSRAIVFRVLNQLGKAESDLQTVCEIAQKKYEKEPGDWSNVFALAFYRLASGEENSASQLYKQALSGKTSHFLIKVAMRDLKEFMVLFPQHNQAQIVYEMLQQHLDFHAGG